MSKKTVKSISIGTKVVNVEPEVIPWPEPFFSDRKANDFVDEVVHCTGSATFPKSGVLTLRYRGIEATVHRKEDDTEEDLMLKFKEAIDHLEMPVTHNELSSTIDLTVEHAVKHAGEPLGDGERYRK